ncbi:hypothetical protein BC834DRAFT_904830 [Gloeopeniophorella convolvens]|nr:hypothetical protein BC834DRAFT_904830 [Gloeopeniophorella convolvens]
MQQCNCKSTASSLSMLALTHAQSDKARWLICDHDDWRESDDDLEHMKLYNLVVKLFHTDAMHKWAEKTLKEWNATMLKGRARRAEDQSGPGSMAMVLSGRVANGTWALDPVLGLRQVVRQPPSAAGGSGSGASSTNTPSAGTGMNTPSGGGAPALTAGSTPSPTSSAGAPSSSGGAGQGFSQTPGAGPSQTGNRRCWRDSELEEEDDDENADKGDDEDDGAAAKNKPTSKTRKTKSRRY